MAFSSLQRRTITASLLAPLAIAGVLLLPTPYLAVLLGLVLLAAAWEWSALAGIVSTARRLVFVVLFACALLLLSQALPGQYTPPALALLVCWWLGLALYLFRVSEPQASRGFGLTVLLMGLPVLLGPWLAVVHLHGFSARGPQLTLFLLLLIWTADIAAYFTGRRWGTTKLAPSISPGKTRAGVYGALFGAALAGLLLAGWLDLPASLTGFAVTICVLTAFVSVVGDLFESLIKRRRGVKDSGRLLPGHGGVLDRIDSLTAAAPVYTLGILWLEAQL